MAGGSNDKKFPWPAVSIAVNVMMIIIVGLMGIVRGQDMQRVDGVCTDVKELQRAVVDVKLAQSDDRGVVSVIQTAQTDIKEDVKEIKKGVKEILKEMRGG